MNAAHELAVLKTMAAELDDYLLSDVLFWQMQASSSFPKLSLGAMLLARARLRAAAERLEPGQQAEQQRAERQIETTLSKWAVAAENKAEREMHARLNLWSRFLEECREQGNCAENYAQEVTQRAIVALLVREFPRLAESAEAKRIGPVDSLIRSRLAGGNFVWPPELSAGFPQPDFWFLYGRLA